ncbi:MAG: MATE family efflux transporter [Bacteroidetes bacterium]|nr:MATE family efflux transporter [Bacteroidota bacterium]MBP9790303.1 MATE family efflux transporter [Bacteroidia bacterium]
MAIGTSYKEIVKMAMPVIFGAFAMTLVNITDTAFLGRIGETELGASAVGGILYFVFAMIGVSIGTGTQIIISRRKGENNDSSIGQIFDQSIIILFITGLVLFVFLKWIAPPLLPLILNQPELVESTREFLAYRSYGIFFILTATAFRSLFVGIALPKIYGTYSFLMAGINIVLGYAMIFGNWGFPKMGIAGAGLASSIAELLSLLFIWGYTFLNKGLKQYKVFKFESFKKELTIKIFELSSPIIVQNLLSMGAWFLFFVFIEKIGSHELAISNIVRGAYMISMTPFWGFSVAANSMVSNVIGQGKKEEVLGLVQKIIKLTLVVSLLMIVVNLIFPVQILSIFTNDIKLINDSMGCLQIVDIALIFFGFAIVSINAVSGTGATKVALYIEIAAIFIYILYAYLMTFVFKGTVEMVWFSEVLYWLFAGVVCYWYIRSGTWKKLKNI